MLEISRSTRWRGSRPLSCRERAPLRGALLVDVVVVHCDGRALRAFARSPLRRCARHAEFSRKSWRMVLSVHPPRKTCHASSDLTLFFSQLYWYRYRTQFSTVLYWNSAGSALWINELQISASRANPPRHLQSLGHSICAVFTARARTYCDCVIVKHERVQCRERRRARRRRARIARRARVSSTACSRGRCVTVRGLGLTYTRFCCGGPVGAVDCRYSRVTVFERIL